MLRQDPEAGGHKKLAPNRFCVVTQSKHVATQLRLLHHNSFTIEDYKQRQRPTKRT